MPLVPLYSCDCLPIISDFVCKKREFSGESINKASTKSLRFTGLIGHYYYSSLQSRISFCLVSSIKSVSGCKGIFGLAMAIFDTKKYVDSFEKIRRYDDN